MAKSKENKELSFEESLAELGKIVEQLKQPDTTLETAVKSYEDAIQYYNQCFQLLTDAKQKIEVFEKKHAQEE